MLRNEELIWTSRSVIKAFYVYSDTVPSNFVKIDRVVSAYPANRQIDTQNENTTLDLISGGEIDVHAVCGARY